MFRINLIVKLTELGNISLSWKPAHSNQVENPERCLGYNTSCLRCKANAYDAPGKWECQIGGFGA